MKDLDEAQKFNDLKKNEHELNLRESELRSKSKVTKPLEYAHVYIDQF
jgi:hypothetical protein